MKLLLLIALFSLALAASAQAATLAVLPASRTALAQPNAHARHLSRVSATRPITGQRTTLPVVSRRKGWVQVLLPGRPNSSTGWLRASSVRLHKSLWAITVDLSQRRVRVHRGGHVIRSVRAVVGAPNRPTPTGRFFVEESTTLWSGGPTALALSARSNVYQEFKGGPGQVAIHGREHLGGVLGTASSHGCIRVANPKWLTDHIPAGTLVTIHS